MLRCAPWARISPPGFAIHQILEGPERTPLGLPADVGVLERRERRRGLGMDRAGAVDLETEPRCNPRTVASVAGDGLKYFIPRV